MYKKILYVLVSAVLFTACISKEPQEVRLHTDECEYCKMVISDRQFASQMVSDKGKAYKFDSVECMAAFAIQQKDKTDQSAFYVVNYQNPNEWIPLEEAVIYQSDEVRSPMGLSFFAIKEEADVQAVHGDAEQKSWNETKQIVKTEWDVKE